MLGRLFGTKRYSQSGNVITDIEGMTYNLDSDGNVWLKSSNPDIRTSADKLTGQDAKETWDDLVNRVNDKNHQFYYW